jgi:C-terminal processing protease CtpA/Prc
MGGANFNVRDGYRLRIPVTTWQTWNDMQIEKAGVAPDLPAEFYAEAASCERDCQLEAALQIATNLR